MKSARTIRLAASAAMAACLWGACSRMGNPEELVLPPEPFTLTAKEYRCRNDHSWEWSISPTGETRSLTEDLCEMTVTAVGRFVIESDREVNLESSNPRAVRVTRESGKRYLVEWGSDGEAVLTAWNGSRSYSVSFPVKARRLIPIEGIRFLIDGQLRIARCTDKDYLAMYTNQSSRETDRQLGELSVFDVPPYPQYDGRGEVSQPYDRPYHMEFAGTEPLNASYRLMSGEINYPGPIAQDLYDPYNIHKVEEYGIRNPYTLLFGQDVWMEDLVEDCHYCLFGAMEGSYDTWKDPDSHVVCQFMHLVPCLSDCSERSPYHVWVSVRQMMHGD